MNQDRHGGSPAPRCGLAAGDREPLPFFLASRMLQWHVNIDSVMQPRQGLGRELTPKALKWNAESPPLIRAGPAGSTLRNSAS